MKKWLAIFSFIGGISLLSAQDGAAIMKRVYDQPEPKTTHALIQMILTDQKGEQNERVIEQWSAEDNNGDNHSVMVFHSPASVKNTRFLTKENQGRDDDQWIFLPSLNRVRRIASGEGDSSFMGTEFTYQDLGSREYEDYTYQYLRSERAQGFDCYVIEARPKPGVDSSYHHTISWITTDDSINTAVKMEIYESETDLLKVMTVEDLSEVNGYWIPRSLTMENVQSNRSTTLVQQRLELDKPVNTRRFSQRFLETGRTE